MNNSAKLAEWCAAVLPGIVRFGLDVEIAEMFYANSQHKNKKVVLATAIELAEIISELPVDQIEYIESLASHIEEISLRTLLSPRASLLGQIVKRGHIRNEKEYRVVKECLDDGLLHGADAENAAVLLGKFISLAR